MQFFSYYNKLMLLVPDFYIFSSTETKIMKSIELLKYAKYLDVVRNKINPICKILALLI